MVLLKSLSIVLLLCVSLALSQQECKQLGEYCINHSECCSKSCVSFLYKCTRNLQEQYKPQKPMIVDRIGEPTRYGSLDALIREVFGGEPSTMGVTTRLDGDGGTPTRDKNCAVVGSRCYTGGDCCTGRCHGYLHQCVT